LHCNADISANRMSWRAASVRVVIALHINHSLSDSMSEEHFSDWVSDLSSVSCEVRFLFVVAIFPLTKCPGRQRQPRKESRMGKQNSQSAAWSACLVVSICLTVPSLADEPK